tara:strand:+ start:720 stop:824 length:105 start_codon:yes stop_codon:yes gene_type:complete
MYGGGEDWNHSFLNFLAIKTKDSDPDTRTISISK